MIEYFDIELDKAAKEIKKINAKRVCIQLPDGLKPYANIIYDELKKKTNAELYIWFGSCFGACDIPFYLERYGFDLIIQWGHAKWLHMGREEGSLFKKEKKKKNLR